MTLTSFDIFFYLLQIVQQIFANCHFDETLQQTKQKKSQCPLTR